MFSRENRTDKNQSNPAPKPQEPRIFPSRSFNEPQDQPKIPYTAQDLQNDLIRAKRLNEGRQGMKVTTDRSAIQTQLSPYTILPIQKSATPESEDEIIQNKPADQSRIANSQHEAGADKEEIELEAGQEGKTPSVQRFAATPREIQLQEDYQRAKRWNEQCKGMKATTDRSAIQRKLNIGAPGDQYEQEADRVAAEVVKSINQPSAVSTQPGVPVQRLAETEGEEIAMKSLVQRRDADTGGEASTDLESAINSARGGGQPLDAGLQRSMGQAMGADFSGVKVHTDAQSDQLNQSIHAKAFTTGQDVFFRQGEYNPGSRGGQELIAHELTHVVQQNGGAVRRKSPLPPQQLPPHPATETPSAENPDKEAQKGIFVPINQLTIPHINSHVQRTIEYDNWLYFDGDEEKFIDMVPKEGIKDLERDIANAFSRYEQRPKSINDALKDITTIYKVKKEKEGETGVKFKWDVVETEIERERQKKRPRTEEAGSTGVYVDRDAVADKKVLLTGIISCVGIVIEAWDKEGKVKAAAVGHFVTPRMTLNGELNSEGKEMLSNLRQYTQGKGEEYTARLLVAKGEMEGAENSETFLEAKAAAKKIQDYYHGIKCTTEEGSGSREYILKVSGESQIN